MGFVPFFLSSILLSETRRGQCVNREALVSEQQVHTSVLGCDVGPGVPPVTNLLCRPHPVRVCHWGPWREAGRQEEGDRLVVLCLSTGVATREPPLPSPTQNQPHGTFSKIPAQRAGPQLQGVLLKVSDASNSQAVPSPQAAGPSSRV